MARKESVTHEMLKTTAFSMLREEGMENVTARKLAAKVGCSTQPIFRVYTGMEDIDEELFQLSMEYFEAFYQKFPHTEMTPFVNLGLAYIQFAVEEKHVFRTLFLSEKRYGKSLYEILNGTGGAVGKEFAVAQNEGCRNPGELFMKMWILIHGAATMSLTGDYDLNMDDTRKLLKESYKAFRGLA